MNNHNSMLLEQLSSTMISAADAVILVDNANRIFSLNHSAERLLGCRNREARGRELEEIFRLKSESGTTGGDQMSRAVLASPNGKPDRTIEFACQPLFSDEGNFMQHSHYGSIIIFREKKSPVRSGEGIHNEDYKEIIGLLPDIVSVIYTDGSIAFVSPSVKNHLGYDAKDLIHKSAENFIHQEDLESLLSYLRSGSGSVQGLAEFRFRHRDGSWKVIEANGRQCTFHDKPAIVLSLRDLTEKKLRETLAAQRMNGLEQDILRLTADTETSQRNVTELEEQNRDFKSDQQRLNKEILELVQTNNQSKKDRSQLNEKLSVLLKKNTELSRSNSELEQFAYIASHDLQEPLRMIASYTQLLAQRYKGKLDNDADDFINFAVDGANRMQELINDLLAYSRVSTAQREFKLIDMKTVLDRTLSNLEFAIHESGATIEAEPLPMIFGDMLQLTQVFQNVIGNSIKFRSDSPPKIDISVDRQDKQWVISVKDNGIGFKPQYSDRIFVIFQRLHSKKDYPGTGIGLAICKKIIERHGGTIWVESEPGKGSTFFFTFPVAG